MNEKQVRKMNTLMYFLIKNAARDSYQEFLDGLEISDEDYAEIKKEWAKIGITETYI